MIKKFFVFNLFLLKVLVFFVEFRNWTSKIPKVKSSRIISICLSSSLAYLKGNVNQMLITSKIGQLIFSIDDLIDENNISPATLESIFKDSKIRVNGYFIKEIYDEIITLISRENDLHQINPNYVQEFNKSLDEFIHEITNESNVNYDLDQGKHYWENRKITSGIKVVSLSILTLTQKDFIDGYDFIDSCALMVRLANDLRSYGRERESNSLNVISCRVRNGEEEARVLSDVRKQIRNIRTSLIRNPDLVNQNFLGVFLLCDFITSMYSEMDFHSTKFFSLAKLWISFVWSNI